MIETNVIIYIIKSLMFNCYVYYCYKKILNLTNINLKNDAIILGVNLLLVIFKTYIEFHVNSFISSVVNCLIYGIVIGMFTKRKIGYSIVLVIFSYAFCAISMLLSVVIVYVIYSNINVTNEYINLFIILLIQYLIIYSFFKIKRFEKGIVFMQNKLSDEYVNIILIDISVIVIILYCLTGSIYDEITWNLLLSLILFGITMFILIPKTVTLYYKQKLLKTTVNSYKEKIEEKELEISKLKDEKYKISKIVHEFYNRQEALEQAVKDEEFRKRIKNLTTEFSNEFEKIKTLDKLEETEIAEIDDMFKYMQKECDKNNIKFHLKIEGNIHYLINNIIPKNKLETLIGDHIRDAINAVKSSNEENREILVILGKKDEIYELTIFDTGIEFEIDTLLKLGKERVTTYKNKGGNGIGFMTTFETMKQTGASLIIEEFQPNKDRFYTKSVTIKFDGENQYKVISYRQNLLVK